MKDRVESVNTAEEVSTCPEPKDECKDDEDGNDRGNHSFRYNSLPNFEFPFQIEVQGDGTFVAVLHDTSNNHDNGKDENNGQSDDEECLDEEEQDEQDGDKDDADQDDRDDNEDEEFNDNKEDGDNGDQDEDRDENRDGEEKDDDLDRDINEGGEEENENEGNQELSLNATSTAIIEAASSTSPDESLENAGVEADTSSDSRNSTTTPSLEESPSILTEPTVLDDPHSSEGLSGSGED